MTAISGYNSHLVQTGMPFRDESGFGDSMRRVASWFSISGTIGVLAAMAVYALGSIPAVRTNFFFNPYVMLALSPASILGLAEPTTLTSELFFLGIVLGSNFIVYGLVGAILCGVRSLLRHRITAP